MCLLVKIVFRVYANMTEGGPCALTQEEEVHTIGLSLQGPHVGHK